MTYNFKKQSLQIQIFGICIKIFNVTSKLTEKNKIFKKISRIKI